MPAFLFQADSPRPCTLLSPFHSTAPVERLSAWQEDGVSSSSSSVRAAVIVRGMTTALPCTALLRTLLGLALG